MPSYQVSKVVLGSFNQANIDLFGETAGTQCSCNALYACFWTYMRPICEWETTDLDFVLVNGDKIYKSLNARERYLSFEDLPRSIQHDGHEVFISFLNLEDGEAITSQNAPFLRNQILKSDINEFRALMMINGFTIAIFKSRNLFYLFDPHSRDIQGLPVADGKSCLLRFQNLLEVEKYIQYFYLECQEKSFEHFQIQFIKMTMQEDQILVKTNFRNFKRRQGYDKEKRQKCYEKDKTKVSKHYQCNKTKVSKHYQRNKVEICRRVRSYFEAHKEEILKKKVSYFETHKEEILKKEHISMSKIEEK